MPVSTGKETEAGISNSDELANKEGKLEHQLRSTFLQWLTVGPGAKLPNITAWLCPLLPV